MTDTVPVVGDRPVWAVDRQGRKVCVSIHDQWSITERKRLLAVVATTHPDRLGARYRSEAYHAALRALRRHDATEVQWYRGVRLTPPRRDDVRVLPAKDYRRLLGQWNTRKTYRGDNAMKMIMTLRFEGPDGKGSTQSLELDAITPEVRLSVEADVAALLESWRKFEEGKLRETKGGERR